MKPEKGSIFHNRYLLLEKLGVGGFSEVWKALDRKAGDMVVAVKIFAPGSGLDSNGLEVFSKEYSIVFNLKHPNLLKPTYFDDCEGQPYLVLPFMKNGSCLKCIGEFSEKDAALLLKQIGGALNEMHSQEHPLIHLDISPDNILPDDEGNYLLSDFGISTKIRRTLTKSIGKERFSSGKQAYMAPERFSKKLTEREPKTSNDIYSFGVTLFELLTGVLPFGELGGINQSTGLEIPELPETISQGLQKLIYSCIAPDPEKRPSASMLSDAAGEFLKTGIWPVIEKKVQKSQEETDTEPLKKPSRPTQESIYTPAATPGETEVIERPKKKNKKALLLTLSIISLIGIAAIIVWYMNKGLSAEEKATEQKRLDSLKIMEAWRIFDSIAAQDGTTVDSIGSESGNTELMNNKIIDNKFNIPTTIPVNENKSTTGDYSSTVTDYDGNVYHTVKIGTQVWMVENLNVTHYRNGDPIPNVTDNTEWNNLNSGAYCNYDNETFYIPFFCKEYGRLYNWYAVNDNRKLAPDGWHVPTYDDWTILLNYLGGESVAGGKMKESGTTHWKSPNTMATNSSGFSGLPGGYRDGTSFYDIRFDGYWWTSDEDSQNTNNAWFRSLNNYKGDVTTASWPKNGGYSVRCIKD